MFDEVVVFFVEKRVLGGGKNGFDLEKGLKGGDDE